VSRTRIGRLGGDRGASVAGFVLLMAPLLLLLFLVLQVAVWFYARTVVAAATADAARFTASTAASESAGAQRAHDQIADGLGDRSAARIRCTDTFGYDVTGLPITTVHCQGRPQLLLVPYAFPVGVDAHSSVLREAGR
jgi:Flp pilus assembly protein TadG